MKIRILVIIVIISGMSCFSQNLSQEERMYWVGVLDSASYFDRSPAIDQIYADSIYEAIPKIEQIFWKSNNTSKCTYLSMLQYLNASTTNEFAQLLLDTLKMIPCPYNLRDQDRFKECITEVLFKRGDYSTSEYVFELINKNKGKNYIPFDLLPIIYLKIPQDSLRAKNLVITIAKSDEYNYGGKEYNYGAMWYLEQLFGAEQNETYRYVLLSDFDDTNKIQAIEFLLKYNYPQLDDLLKDNIASEDIPFVRFLFVEAILHNYSNVSNIKWVKDYIPTEPDEKYRDHMEVWLNTRRAGPQKPNIDVSLNIILDTLFAYTGQCLEVGFLADNSLANELKNRVDQAKQYLNLSDSVNCAKQIKLFQSRVNQVYSDSAGSYPKYVSKEGYKFLYYYPQYILDRLPEPPSGLPVKLKNSTGMNLPGGSLQYYEGEWKDAINNDDGTFTVTTEQTKVSLRMTYEYGSQTLNNVPVTTDTAVFQTVDATIELRNSQNLFIEDSAMVKYYAGGWRDFDYAVNGVAHKELLPNEYSFRITYAYASNDKKQNIGTNSTVTFNTVNANVELRNSANNLITEESSVKYYSGGWRDFGSTTTGLVQKELLPNEYSFRMTYAYTSNDKKQNIGTNSTVTFNTVNANVELRNSANNLITGESSVKYYSGGWRDFGSTTTGVVQKELLPNEYSFRMTYAYASSDKKQNIGTNSTVTFNTINANVELRNSANNLITGESSVKYYSGGWRDFGSTTTGLVQKELLPNEYSFRMTYAYASNDKKQNIGTNSTVTFNTINTNVELRNSANNLITEESSVKYYSGGWREFGSTTNGFVQKELLPNEYSFRMTYAYASNDKKQNIGTNSTVTFNTVNANVELRNSANNLITEESSVKYYSGGWRDFGSTSNGSVQKELLPNEYSFRMTYAYASNDKKQNIGTNNTVTFSTVLCTLRVKDSQNQPINNAQTSYYSGGWRQIGYTVNGEITKELLSVNLTFRANYNGRQTDKVQNLSSGNIVDLIISQ